MTGRLGVRRDPKARVELVPEADLSPRRAPSKARPGGRLPGRESRSGPARCLGAWMPRVSIARDRCRHLVDDALHPQPDPLRFLGLEVGAPTDSRGVRSEVRSRNRISSARWSASVASNGPTSSRAAFALSMSKNVVIGVILARPVQAALPAPEAASPSRTIAPEEERPWTWSGRCARPVGGGSERARARGRDRTGRRGCARRAGGTPIGSVEAGRRIRRRVGRGRRRISRGRRWAGVGRAADHRSARRPCAVLGELGRPATGGFDNWTRHVGSGRSRDHCSAPCG
jgi:hypothetical protein